MKKMTIIFVAFVLCACATKEEKAAKYQASLVNTCLAYGYKQDSPDFPKCMMQVDQSNQNRRSALLGAYLSSNPFAPKLQSIPQATITTPIQSKCVTNGNTSTCTSQ